MTRRPFWISMLILAGIVLSPARGAVVGPDTFGYYLFPNTDPGGVPFSYIDIRSTGTNLGLSDDSYSIALTMAGSFSFYGNTYSQVYASSNGFASFGAGSASLSNQNLPDSAGPNNLIAVVWDDLAPGELEGVYFQTFANSPHPSFTGPVTVIQWDVHHYGSASAIVDAELLLIHDTNQFLMQFNSLGEGGSGSTTGMENSAGTVGLTYAYNLGSSLYPGLTVFGSTTGFGGGSEVPEPSTVSLFMAGLAALGLVIRRRR